MTRSSRWDTPSERGLDSGGGVIVGVPVEVCGVGVVVVVGVEGVVGVVGGVVVVGVVGVGGGGCGGVVVVAAVVGDGRSDGSERLHLIAVSRITHRQRRTRFPPQGDGTLATANSEVVGSVGEE